MADRRRFPPDVTFNEWHRVDSLARYLPYELARDLKMIDIDNVEYCSRCGEPLAIIETARDTGKKDQQKHTTYIERLALRSNVPAYLVFYTLNDTGDDVTHLRVRKVHPRHWLTQEWTPAEYSEWLVELRRRPHGPDGSTCWLKRCERLLAA